jgi:hypothetical protein
VDRSRRSEKLDGFPNCGEGSWPRGSRGATRGETLGGPERSPPGEGGAVWAVWAVGDVVGATTGLGVVATTLTLDVAMDVVVATSSTLMD